MHTRTRATALSALAFLFVAACGGSDDTADATLGMDARDGPVLQAAEPTWVRVASEGQMFTLEQPTRVRYGAGGTWVERDLPAGQAICTNDFFGGDPLRGIVKSCEALRIVDWTYLVDEGQPFALTAPTRVRYGAGSTWVERDVPAGQAFCTNDFFGTDPLRGVFKHCETQGGTSSGAWSFVANEWGAFTLATPRRVRYGIGTVWIERDLPSGQVSCTNTFFGRDPLVGIVKRCEVLDGAPPPPSPPPPSPPPPPPTPQPGSPPQLRAVQAFPNLSFTTLTFLTHAGDGSNRMFAVQQAGQIRVFANNAATIAATNFLDLSSKVDFSGEGGALGLAFDPDYRNNGYFYVAYTVFAPNRKVRLSRFRVGADANVADPNSERVVYEYDHSQTNHFGSWIGFGPDRLLYMSTGDNGRQELQSTSSPYGKVLRMRINADGSYSLPADNPWGSLAYAMGFRNPWRCSFDRVGGALWCGDVGEVRLEEINIVRRGAHYGWDHFEGDLVGSTPTNQPYSFFEPALHRYPRSDGGSVTGGYVYRGSALPGLVGRYVYGDFVSSRMWAVTMNAAGQLAGVTQIASNVGSITTFGEDEAGELFAGTVEGRLLRFVAQ